MKRLLLIPALMLLSTAVNAGPAAYLPRMVSVSIIETTVPEVSGLCLAPAGDGMLAASDEDGLYHVAWDGTTTPFFIEDDMDCEGVQRTINLCTPEGKVRASWSVSFIDNGESIYVDHEHGCLWVGDDTTSRIYKIQFEGL